MTQIFENPSLERPETTDAPALIRHAFPLAHHGQGPQSGDTILRKGESLPFLLGVSVPSGKELVFFSGHTPPVVDHAAAPDSREAFGDTYTQTVGAIQELAFSLNHLGLNLSHLIQLRALLVGDPALGGRMDCEGFSRAYAAFFGTTEQPNQVARTRMQVVALVNPGWMVELEAVAVR